MRDILIFFLDFTATDLALNIAGTIIGGLILALLLFIFDEYIFAVRNVSGQWTAELTIIDSTLERYKGLKMYYSFHLLQKKLELVGSGEKTGEKQANGTSFEYQRKKRILNTIEGYVDRKYLARTKIYFHVTEEGLERKTRSTFVLRQGANQRLEGSFRSTAASAQGRVILSKS